MNEHKNIITIEDEIKEFSDKPVKSSALYKKAKELESNAVPDASEASVGDVLSLDEDKKPTWSAPSGGGAMIIHQDDGGVCDHTWQEMYDAATAGKIVMLIVEDSSEGEQTKLFFANTFVADYESEWVVVFKGTDTFVVTTDGPNGYPTGGGGGK